MKTIFDTPKRDARVVLSFGALGLFVNELHGFRMWLTDSDRSVVSTIIWTGFAAWLLVPAIWACTRMGRVFRPGPANSDSIAECSLSSAIAVIFFAYVTAAMALSMMSWFLRHPRG
jgi:hypothetical protein